MVEGLVNYCIITIPKSKSKEEFCQNFSNFAVKFYSNAKTERTKILTENAGVFIYGIIA